MSNSAAIPRELLEELGTRLPGTTLSSLLLEVMRRRAGRRTPADVLAQYQRDRFTCPAAVDQRVSIEVDCELLAAATGFEAIELSPVAPLGTSSSMALSDQNRVLSALRRTEVVSDPTNVLALECAQRLRGKSEAAHLATTQRVVRAQPAPDKPGFAQHFRIFVLASGGQESKDHGFSVDSLVAQVKTMVRALDRLERAGYAFANRRIDLLATREREALADRVSQALTGVIPITRRPLEHAYYSGGLRYMLWATTIDGEELPLADGGTFDWLARLLSDRRAVFVASGMGAQLVPIRFRRP